MSKTYIIKSGESLSIIAGREYGDIKLWPVIAQANPSITNPNLVYPGQIITIPDITDAVEVQAEVIESIPGNTSGWSINWKRVIPWALIIIASGVAIHQATKKKKPVSKKPAKKRA